MHSRRAVVVFIGLLIALCINQGVHGQEKPQSASRPELVPQLGHANALTAVAFSPDGKYAFTGSYDKSVRVWEVLTGREIFTLEGHTESIAAIAGTKDGKTLITAGNDNTVRFWDRTTGKQIRKLDRTSMFALSSTGKDMLACPPKGLQFLDPATGGERMTWEMFGRQVYRVAYAADGNSLACVSIPVRTKPNEIVVDDATYFGRVLNVSTNKEQLLKGHTRLINSLAFSPDGKRVVTGSNDETARIWDAATGKELVKLKHTRDVMSVAFAPNGKTVITGCWDTTARIWDAESGKELAVLKHPTLVNAVAYSPDGLYVLTGSYDSIGRIWEVATGRELGHLAPRSVGVQSIAVAPNGKHVLIGAEDGTARLWDLSEAKELQRLNGHTSRVVTVAFSHDGKFALTGSWDGLALMWDVATGLEVRRFKGHTSWVRSVAFSPDDKTVMTGSEDATVRLWDAASGKERSGAPGPPTGRIVASVAYSPDGRWIAVGRFGSVFSDHSTARLYGSATGKELRQFDVEQGTFAIAFSADSKRLVTISNDNYARVWEVANGRCLSQFRCPGSNPNAVAFAPDGKTVLCDGNDGTARLWDASSGKEIHMLRGHRATATAVAFAQNGKLLLTGGVDGTVRLWDADTGKEKCMFLNARHGLAVTTPQSYYLAPREALPAVAFRVGGRGASFEQFDLRLNRPDLVLQRIGLAPAELTDAYERAYQKRLRRLNYREATLGDLLNLPEVVVTSERPLSTKEKTLKLTVKANDGSFLLDRIEVHVNGVPLGGVSGIPLRAKKAKTWEQEIDVPLSIGENRIQVSAVNEKAVGALPETFVVRCEAPLPKPALHVVVVGISDYKDTRFRLTYADKDARDVADFWESQRDKFSGGKIVRLLNGDATRENILKVKDALMKSNPDDLVVLFFAGHGLLDAKLDYYYATADIDFADPAKRGLSYESIENLLDAIPARKKLLLMDTCHSGELDKEALAGATKLPEGTIKARGFRGIDLVDAPKELRSSRQLLEDMFADLRRGTGAVVIAASGGAEFALESADWKNGVFTYALLQGLKANKADRTKDGRIQVSELRDYVLGEVQRLTRGRQRPALRRENLEFDFALDAGPPPVYQPPISQELERSKGRWD